MMRRRDNLMLSSLTLVGSLLNWYSYSQMAHMPCSSYYNPTLTLVGSLLNLLYHWLICLAQFTALTFSIMNSTKSKRAVKRGLVGIIQATKVSKEQEFVVALHDFEPENNDELSILKGDVICVHEKSWCGDYGWWCVFVCFT